MSRNVWHTEHAVSFTPELEVRHPACLGTAVIHVDEVRISNATDREWVKVSLQVTEFEEGLPYVALEALKRMRWSVEHRRVFVEDPAQEGVWTPLGSRPLDRVVGALVEAARVCDASVRRSLA